MARTIGFLAWAAMAAAMAACGGSVDGTGGSGGTGGCCRDPDVPGCPECAGGAGPGGTGGTSSSSSGTGGGVGGGDICGGLAGVPCAADEYCDFGNDRCGGDDDQGVCKKRPQGCPDNFFPTCGCDGMVYGNECDANSAGVDIANIGGCTAPEGQFGCGAHFCDKATQYCQRDGSDVGNFPDGFACHDLPAGCSPAASCACLANVTCGGNCEATSDGGFMVTCLGG